MHKGMVVSVPVESWWLAEKREGVVPTVRSYFTGFVMCVLTFSNGLKMHGWLVSRLPIHLLRCAACIAARVAFRREKGRVAA